jgi:hypothetical protein
MSPSVSLVVKVLINSTTHLDPRRARAEVIDADGAAFIGQSEDEVRIGHNHSVVRIYPCGALSSDDEVVKYSLIAALPSTRNGCNEGVNAASSAKATMQTSTSPFS